MSYFVNITDEAKEDLRQIYFYIAYNLSAPEIARAQIVRIKRDIIGLNYMPTMFRRYGKEPWYTRGLRIMPVDNYVVFYLIDDANETVNVIRVIYGGMDLERQLDDKI
ncbi:MAG: type II toxin-antitoxin system RelE/ParE family toxin [Phascolarctobacterium sp.]|uniref:type II toxin-antitoxin system RelE/ParE family toxin n=1 Tax=Phascolarctobacterium sp. TaxID=2049039 RepID=UPI0026DC787B|nr:type II toxin-antitoxin system RelE/ParE family toxin [Phascolarctobacterium sp.]MDO4922019.1 type II toxin-antitoxin system RelE/ParE family toxin [Phascolarctobacterium sp.]